MSLSFSICVCVCVCGGTTDRVHCDYSSSHTHIHLYSYEYTGDSSSCQGSSYYESGGTGVCDMDWTAVFAILLIILLVIFIPIGLCCLACVAGLMFYGSAFALFRKRTYIGPRGSPPPVIVVYPPNQMQAGYPPNHMQAAYLPNQTQAAYFPNQIQSAYPVQSSAVPQNFATVVESPPPPPYNNNPVQMGRVVP